MIYLTRAKRGAYYFVHHREFDDNPDGPCCTGVYVWAKSPKNARAKAEGFMPDLRAARVERTPEADAHRDVLGDLFDPGRRRTTPPEARVLRLLKWHDGNAGPRCDSCGLYEWDGLDESGICADCARCRECGCGCAGAVGPIT